MTKPTQPTDCHGNPIPCLDTPPAGCQWKMGDKVTFTNDYGVVFTGHSVIGFTLPEDEMHGRTVYIDTDAPWFPVRPESLAAAPIYLRQSESYPKYHLIRRQDGLHVALKAQTKDTDDGDGYFSVGQIMDEENFETACDNAEEESRVLMEQARQEFGIGD